MTEKFPLGDNGGLVIVKNFISEDEEQQLLLEIENNKWDKRLKRWTQHYGYKYNYRSRSITNDDYIGELPIWTHSVTERITNSKYVCESGKLIDQIIVNRYLPGEGINPHIDSLNSTRCKFMCICEVNIQGLFDRIPKHSLDQIRTTHSIGL